MSIGEAATPGLFPGAKRIPTIPAASGAGSAQPPADNCALSSSGVGVI
jgi:hypothetical protein